MYILTATSGVLKGKSWRITESGLVIGRGLASSILIPDPTVSRKHCEIRLQENEVILTNLSPHNITLVGGEVRQEGTLKDGCELSVGSVMFLITRIAGGALPGEPNPHDTDTRKYVATLSAVTDSEDGQPNQQIRTVRDMADVFSLLRAVVQANSLRDFVHVLNEQIHGRLSQKGVCLARFHGTSGEMTLYSECENTLGSALCQGDEFIKRCFTKQTPMMRSTKLTEPDGREIALCVAPISIATQQIGVFGVLVAPDSRTDAQDKLDYITALAYYLAPLLLTVEQIDWLQHENEWLRMRSGEHGTLLGNSPAMQRVRDLVSRFAPLHFPVMILGETGTGKELVARALHDLSHRAQGPYVTVNCAAIQSTLFESEFFGHERGAFSGADRSRAGRLEQAHGGTLFMDEIGELSLENQAKTLRAIEHGRFHRVGSERETHVDVRIVAATNRNIEAMIQEGKFREDLLHRMSTFQIEIPPLRDRHEDIPVLAQSFLNVSAEHSKKRLRGFTPEALEYLRALPLSGNARELRNRIERATVFCQGELVTRQDLDSSSESNAKPDLIKSEARTLQSMEDEYIDRAIRECGGNISAAAKMLGIHRTTLHNKLAERKTRA